mgnify:CR=1 FL=1
MDLCCRVLGSTFGCCIHFSRVITELPLSQNHSWYMGISSPFTRAVLATCKTVKLRNDVRTAVRSKDKLEVKINQTGFIPNPTLAWQSGGKVYFYVIFSASFVSPKFLSWPFRRCLCFFRNIGVALRICFGKKNKKIETVKGDIWRVPETNIWLCVDMLWRCWERLLT